MTDLGVAHLLVGPSAQLGAAPLRYEELGVLVDTPPSRADLQRQLTALAARVAALEAQTPRAYWARFVAWLKGWF